MKTLGIMSSGDYCKFKAILDFYKSNGNVKIVCITDNLKSDIFNVEKSTNVSTKYLSSETALSYFASEQFDLIAINDYRSKLSDNIYNHGKFINLHPSLLPAFKGENALFRAFESGVKVSGITVHTVTSTHDNEKILAQYPVLISNLTHFDEFETMTNNLIDMLYPIVIDKTLNDKLFDFQDLLSGANSCCSGGCQGCKNHG